MVPIDSQSKVESSNSFRAISDGVKSDSGEEAHGTDTLTYRPGRQNKIITYVWFQGHRLCIRVPYLRLHLVWKPLPTLQSGERWWLNPLYCTSRSVRVIRAVLGDIQKYLFPVGQQVVSRLHVEPFHIGADSIELVVRQTSKFLYEFTDRIVISDVRKPIEIGQPNPVFDGRTILFVIRVGKVCHTGIGRYCRRARFTSVDAVPRPFIHDLPKKRYKNRNRLSICAYLTSPSSKIKQELLPLSIECFYFSLMTESPSAPRVV